MTDDLDNFLEDGIEAEPEQQTEVVAEVEADEPETVETEEAPTASIEETKEPAPETVPLSALMGIKSENKELKAQLEALKAQAQPKEEIDIFDNPDGFKNEVLTTAQQMALNAKFEMSEMLVRDKHDDYDQKAEQFEQMVKADPSLYYQMIQSPNPAKYVYDHVSKVEKMSQFENIDAYESAMREKIRAEIMAEFETKPANKVPPSMVDVRSTSAPKASDMSVSLDDILK